MIIKFSKVFQSEMINQVRFIYKDKPRVALKFRKELMKNIKKDLQNPYHFRQSIYSDGDETIRDYIFKGYIVFIK